ncbi:MAG TPA: phosphotransferase [Kofleriaceae bacterium]|jgi:hypothetical protein|nr:phosphotransferase [Kofleriaceae bacterium]
MVDAAARIAAVVGRSLETARHEGRWLALGEDVVAHAADSPDEWHRLELEHRLVDRWRDAGVPVPRVLHVDTARGVQLRQRMLGLSGLQIHDERGSPLFAGPSPSARDRFDSCPLSRFGARVAASYGEVAARIRRAVSLDEARAMGLGPTSRRTFDLGDALARLHASDASPAAKAAAVRSRAWLEALPAADAAIHSDLHFFNLCVDANGTITGLFDFGDSGIDAAATELLYVHSLGADFTQCVLDAYGPIDLDDVRRAHVRTALDHLIWHGPGTQRHAEVVEWATAVLERFC